MFGSLFDPENSFWEFMTNMTHVLFVGLIWIMCCIPIITIGASTTALYDYTLKVASDKESYVVNSFFKSFANNFIKSTILWVLMFLVTVFLVVDAYVCLNMGTALGNFLFFAILGIGILCLITCLYIFPVLAFFQTDIKKTIQSAFVMGIGNLPLTILIIMILGFAGFVTYTAPYLAFALPGFAVYVSSFYYLSVFRKYKT